MFSSLWAYFVSFNFFYRKEVFMFLLEESILQKFTKRSKRKQKKKTMITYKVSRHNSTTMTESS